MNVSRNPSYLFQSRHGIYYFRARIPLSIKSRYSTTKNEVRKSLNTHSVVVTRKDARRLWVAPHAKSLLPLNNNLVGWRESFAYSGQAVVLLVYCTSFISDGKYGVSPLKHLLI